METYRDIELFHLRELGQFLKNVLEFLFLNNTIDDVLEIKWNIQHLDWPIPREKVYPEREFFLEIVIVLKQLMLDKEKTEKIKLAIEEYFPISNDTSIFKKIEDQSFVATRMNDVGRDDFNFKRDSKNIPIRFNQFEFCISIESFLRDTLPSPKLILSSKDFSRHEEKVISRLMKERDEILKQIKEYEKPVIICEGKTDKTIIETAWNKLNPKIRMPFEIMPSGVYLEINESEGNADQVRKLLESIANLIPPGKYYIGLFDNDKEGNNQYKGLSKKVFEEYDLTKFKRKHRKYDIYGMLLPVPEFRTKYVSQSMNHRFFEIEHYFHDSILEHNNMKGETVAPDSELFEIKGNKVKFSEIISSLSSKYFENFKVLFDSICETINC